MKQPGCPYASVSNVTSNLDDENHLLAVTPIVDKAAFKKFSSHGALIQ
jgi:hypothetical protein